MLSVVPRCDAKNYRGKEVGEALRDFRGAGFFLVLFRCGGIGNRLRETSLLPRVGGSESPLLWISVRGFVEIRATNAPEGATVLGDLHFGAEKSDSETEAKVKSWLSNASQNV